MSVLPLALLAMIGCCLSAGEPEVVAQLDLGAVGTAWRLSVDLEGNSCAMIAVVLAPGQYAMRLIDQSPTFPVGARTVAQTRALVSGAMVAINGGFFEPSFQPSGLVVIGGHEQQPLAPTGVLSGIVALDAAGRLSLLPRDGALTEVSTAIQAGPFVIDPGGAIGVHQRPAVARRSLLALDDTERALLLVTGAMTLHQLAELLAGHSHAFATGHIERALNLDGGPSTGLSLANDDPAWSLAERGPVRNVLVITPAGK